MLGKVKYEMVEYVGNHATEFRLYEDGTFTVDDEVKPWYKESLRPGAKPWIPAKRKSFKSLVKTMIREGDFDKPDKTK